MDPVICCLLGICCPPYSSEQRDTFVELLAEHLKDETKAKHIADGVFDDFAKVTARLRKLVNA